LGEYKGLSAEKEEVKVVAADVNERLKQLSDRNSRLVSVEREAKEGDTAVIDFEGFLNGVPFSGGKGENHSLELGSHSFVPGFEEQVIGMKAGEEKDIDITFPEDYHADLAGKAVVFKVKVHEVKEKEVPALDDEFAKDVSEFDTLKDLKADLKKQITEERQQSADRAFEDALMNQVAENITAEIPDAMVENQTRQFVDNFKMQLAQNGIQFEQYLQMSGMTESAVMEDAKTAAEHQVRMDLAVAAIIKAENLDATDEEVEAEFQKMSEQYGMDVEMVKKYLQPEQVKDQVISQKAVAIVVDNATATKPEKKKTTKKAEKEAEKEADGEAKEAKKTAKKTTKKAEKEAEKEAEKDAE
jgi:trigger factor